ncbi:MAG: enoyl-CoA hydratase/isomerase family protein [Phycisphaerae bacterium]|nr:enoyl-CoA hydratase/isomerase family protein [Phycisphaerae bacterium]
MGAFIKVETEGGVATVTLDRAPVNVLHIPMMAELNEALGPLARANLAAVVLRAEGKAFCAGVDVADHTPERVGEMMRLFHGIFRRLWAIDALTVALVHGAALGGGCEVACACDVVLASERAKFGQPEVQVGVFPPVAAAILPLRIGWAKAVEVVAAGETIDAAEALRIGLASHVYPAEQFADRVGAYVGRLAGMSRPVVRAGKRATLIAARPRIAEHLDRAERAYLDELMKLSDAHEGIAAFLGKRAPAWTHA